MMAVKHAVIREYLMKWFPRYVIEEADDRGRELWQFKALLERESLIVAFSYEFIDDSTPEDVQTALEDRQIARTMRENPTMRVVVKYRSTELEPRE